MESLGWELRHRPKSQTLDTKLIANCRGLIACIQLANTRFATNLLLYMDNRLAAEILNGNTSMTCWIETNVIRDIHENLNSR